MTLLAATLGLRGTGCLGPQPTACERLAGLGTAAWDRPGCPPQQGLLVHNPRVFCWLLLPPYTRTWRFPQTAAHLILSLASTAPVRLSVPTLRACWAQTQHVSRSAREALLGKACSVAAAAPEKAPGPPEGMKEVGGATLAPPLQPDPRAVKCGLRGEVGNKHTAVGSTLPRGFIHPILNQEPG